ncbi:MAG: DUF1579 domain-containing protein [Saprospiraceae bacterium]|uniref:DUF1579 domain-containing protein n=1 Tax=Candidatus Opimibacter skivensis TaxID=2982028 RepID=A0A9D7SV80_9BACT|nr:DUF1579 domain-containing protein [Candidatus Opimibacter skivensis]
MKKIALFLMVTLVGLTVQSMHAQDQAAMMKAWSDFKTPGDMHKLLASWNGVWNADVSSWMDPSAPPMKSTATVENKMALDGLYQMGHYEGTMMGSPFEGYSTLAYDNAKKMFVNTWIDNMGSGIVVMTGKWDAAKKTLELKGTQTDPMSGKDSPMREVITIIDANTQKMVIYGAGMDGKEAKFMESTMKRAM